MALEAKNRTFHQIFYNPGSQRTEQIVNLATDMNISCIQVPRQSLNNLSSHRLVLHLFRHSIFTRIDRRSPQNE